MAPFLGPSVTPGVSLLRYYSYFVHLSQRTQTRLGIGITRPRLNPVWTTELTHTHGEDFLVEAVAPVRSHRVPESFTVTESV